MTFLFLWLLLPQPPALDTAFRDAMDHQARPNLVAIYRELRPRGPQPEDEFFLNDVGYFLMRQNKSELARDVFELNVVLFPQSANPLDSLAEWHLNQGYAKRAVFYFEQAYARQNDRQTWQRLGQALDTLGDGQRLLDHTKQSVARYDDAKSHDLFLAARLRFAQVLEPIKQLTEGETRFAPTRFWRSRQAMTARGMVPPQVDDQWPTSTYAEQGLDPAMFAAFLDRARGGAYPGLEGVVVARNNAIIGEAYFEGFSRHRPHDTRSVGKSVTALLVAIAADRGKLTFDDRVFDHFPEYRQESQWQPAKDQVRVRHLLGMSSGLDAFDNRADSPGNENTYQALDKGWEEHVLRLPMAFKPGSQLIYASANYALLADLVSRATGQALDQWAGETLFEPLGIQNFRWFRSPAGRAYGAGGIRMTPRDLAKIGNLVLQKGRWQGRQILNPKWIEACVTPQFEGQLWNKSYGFGWYRHQLTAKGKTVDVISAAGNGGQRIWVLPDLQAVIVVTMGHYNSRKQRMADELLNEVLVPSLVTTD